MQYTSLQLRAADAMRHRWPLTPGAPAGFYVDKEGHLIAHGLEVRKVDNAEESDTATDCTDLFDTSGGPPSDTSDSELTSNDGSVQATKSEGSDAGPAQSYASAGRSRDGSESEEDSEEEPLGHDGTFSQADLRRTIRDAENGSIRNMYTMGLMTNDKSQLYSRGHKDVRFELLIDTGSNTTWVRGAKVAEVISSQPKSTKTTPPDATGDENPVQSGQAVPDTSMPLPQAPGGPVGPQGTAIGASSSKVTAPQPSVAGHPKSPAGGSASAETAPAPEETTPAPAETAPAPAEPTAVELEYRIRRITNDRLQSKSRLLDYRYPLALKRFKLYETLIVDTKDFDGYVEYGESARRIYYHKTRAKPGPSQTATLGEVSLLEVGTMRSMSNSSR
ncbi:hypothetical protein FKP32DRAFT_1155284 [Trametes sanguinea]|nr:hypothetical protein FKP32DRAFT_1155284 [Trametes sanguinea]